MSAVSFEGRVLGGRYRLERLLGEGGMGGVYSAVQEDLQRRVAVKVLLGELSLEDVMRFRQEALAAAALGHPNIVQVTDFQSLPGEPPFLVMEALEGESLQDVMKRRGPLPAERTVFIAVQILAALAAAHAARIIHRDIKPANVFLSRTPASSDVVKILDFGIAKFLRDGTAQRGGGGPRTATGIILGTPSYMAPEQALGMDVDARTDLYAVGACMYEMLSGRKPLVATTTGELLFAIARRAPAPLASVAATTDARLAALVDRALAKDPGGRPRTALDMIDALAPWARSAVQRAKKRPGDDTGELDGGHSPPRPVVTAAMPARAPVPSSPAMIESAPETVASPETVPSPPPVPAPHVPNAMKDTAPVSSRMVGDSTLPMSPTPLAARPQASSQPPHVSQPPTPMPMPMPSRPAPPPTPYPSARPSAGVMPSAPSRASFPAPRRRGGIASSPLVIGTAAFVLVVVAGGLVATLAHC
jgi:serine/threonine-protein kinase